MMGHRSIVEEQRSIADEREQSSTGELGRSTGWIELERSIAVERDQRSWWQRRERQGGRRGPGLLQGSQQLGPGQRSMMALGQRSMMVRGQRSTGERGQSSIEERGLSSIGERGQSSIG